LGTDWVSYCSCDFGNKNKMGDVAQWLMPAHL
jgi:hypothetical protein